jgi:CRISPR-associated protein (TIGR03984 family)
MREIKRCLSDTELVSVDLSGDLHNWLTGQATEYHLRWLLAQAEDGVIWGELRKDEQHGEMLALSCAAFPYSGLTLRWETLQQARLFGAMGELLLWPGPQGWQARLIHDDVGEQVDYLDEDHLLWGDHQSPGTTIRDGFMQIAEGSQGIVHAPPIVAAPAETRRAKLRVRHYLSEDEVGVVRIAVSRLVELYAPGEK